MSGEIDGDAQQLSRMTIGDAPALSDAGNVREAALAALAAGGDVDVDCTGVTHLHGAVMQVLLCLRCELERGGRRLVLSNVPANVQRFMDLAGLTQPS
jgi:anti-anti-sigma regulatory factor